MVDQKRTDEQTVGEAARGAWVKPSVERIRAGEAESSPNPSAFDGQFSSGGS